MSKFAVTVCAAVMMLAAAPADAAIIADLGVNPTSAQGDFNSSVGGGAFEDQFTFQLVGGPQFLTIASVTNVFPAVTDFITNFTAAVWNVGPDGIVNNGDDVVVLGPAAATQGCGPIVNCQFAAGTAILASGNYYAEFAGIGGGTSGYGGNIAIVPGPILGGGLPGLLLAIGALLGWRRLRRA